MNNGQNNLDLDGDINCIPIAVRCFTCRVPPPKKEKQSVQIRPANKEKTLARLAQLLELPKIARNPAS